MPQFNNFQSLLNYCSEDQLISLGITLHEDGTVEIPNYLTLPITLEDDPVMGQHDWDNIQEGRFDLGGCPPHKYARPA